MPRLKSTSSKPDPLLLAAVAALLLFGLVMVYDSSVVYAHDFVGGKYHFLIQHIFWLLAGGVAAFLLSRFDYHHWRKLSAPLFFLTLILLVLVLIPGVGKQTLGARRWFSLGPINAQPTEVAKLTLILYLATWLAPNGRRKGRHNLWWFLAVVAGLIGLAMLQPDLGTSIVLGSIAVWIYFASDAPLWHFALTVLAGLFGGGALILISPYRRERLMTFLKPAASDPLSEGYHIKQILIALGSGGLSGLGLGRSRQKYLYLPSVSMDSIFAVIGEELGFLGAAVVILAFGFLIWRAVLAARRAPDKLGQLLAIGITGWLATQVLVNLAAMVSLVPLTGIPLPLISYGGSSLIVTLAGIGVLLNISSQCRRK